MTISVQGYATHSATSELIPFTFKRRDPRPQDVVIDILYCGICHSDIHSARNEWRLDRISVRSWARDRRAGDRHRQGR